MTEDKKIELDMSFGTDDVGFNLARDGEGHILGVRVSVTTATGELFATDLLPLYAAIPKKES